MINTTVMIQHERGTGRPAKLLTVLKQRTPYILAAGAVTTVLYLIFGAGEGSVGDMTQLSPVLGCKRTLDAGTCCGPSVYLL